MKVFVHGSTANLLSAKICGRQLTTNGFDKLKAGRMAHIRKEKLGQTTESTEAYKKILRVLWRNTVTDERVLQSGGRKRGLLYTIKREIGVSGSENTKIQSTICNN